MHMSRCMCFTHLAFSNWCTLTVENIVSVERRIPIHFDGQPICPDMRITWFCESVRRNGFRWLKVIHSMWWREKQKQIIMSINSLRLNDAYIRQWNKPSLVQLKACTAPVRRQAIIWTNAEIFSIGSLEIYFSAIFIEIWTFSFKTIHLNM